MQSCLESFQSAELANFDKSPKKNNEKNPCIPWPSGGRQKIISSKSFTANLGLNFSFVLVNFGSQLFCKPFCLVFNLSTETFDYQSAMQCALGLPTYFLVKRHKLEFKGGQPAPLFYRYSTCI